MKIIIESKDGQVVDVIDSEIYDLWGGPYPDARQDRFEQDYRQAIVRQVHAERSVA